MREEIEGARRHFEAKERCVFCDIVRQELRDGRRVIQENADIIALAPYAPRFPFETWLLPQRHGSRFEDAPRHEYESLARMLKAVLQRHRTARSRSPPYNLIIHSVAVLRGGRRTFYHWHVEIMPKLTQRRRLRVGDRVLHQPDVAGGSARRCCARSRSVGRSRPA